MVKGICLLEELGQRQPNSDRSVLKIVELENDMIERFIPLFGLYMLEVNQIDPDSKVTVQDAELTAADARLYWHLHSQHKILVAVTESGMPCGFLVYEVPYPGLMVARVMFILKECRGTRLFSAFIKAAKSEQARRIVFQTRKSNPPARMLSCTERAGRIFSERRQIGETGDMITWEMELKWPE